MCGAPIRWRRRCSRTSCRSWWPSWRACARPSMMSTPYVCGPVARRMVDAVWPYRDVFITPMAAVAGAVAEHVLALMVEAAPLRRAIVNNGGDIAIHLAEGQSHARRRGRRPVAAADGCDHRDRQRRSGARHRDLRLARPLAVPGHRRFRHRAGGERGDGGRGGDHDRQRGQHRRSRDRASAGVRGARRQRSGRPAGHGRGRAAALAEGRAGAWRTASGARPSCRRAA